MRVLILADDCNPEWPSLPIVAYKAARAIADHAEVVVMTHVRNRENIDKVGIGRAGIRYVDNEYVARPMAKFATTVRGGPQKAWSTAVALNYPSTLFFEWEAWKAVRDELQGRKFDVVHRLSPMSPTLASPMAKWSPVPFILGPVNGGLRWPPGFRSELGREREWLTYVRNAYRALPFLRSTYKNSAAILASFRHTIEDLPSGNDARVIDFPEVGIDPDLFFSAQDRPTRDRKTILFVGRFVPYKLPLVVVQAFVDFPALRQHRLVMIGDGPERPAIEQLIAANGLQGCVELTGWRSQSEVGAALKEADVFAFPSIRELGAGAVVEAMAAGLACVVVDYGGPAQLIDADRGVKIPLGSRPELTRNFGEALQRLVADRHTTQRLGRAAREHAMQHYTWDQKAKKTIEIYEWTLKGGPRPDFWSSPGA